MRLSMFVKMRVRVCFLDTLDQGLGAQTLVWDNAGSKTNVHVHVNVGVCAKTSANGTVTETVDVDKAPAQPLHATTRRAGFCLTAPVASEMGTKKTRCSQHSFPKRNFD